MWYLNVLRWLYVACDGVDIAACSFDCVHITEWASDGVYIIAACHI
jgi:hypothetical protein